MQENDLPHKSIEETTFHQQRRWYWAALSIIAISILLSQIFIQYFLTQQLNDSAVVNLAGRQRMLSQKLTKEILLQAKTPTVENVAVLQKTLSQWTQAHRDLQNGSLKMETKGFNPALLASLYEKANPSFLALQVIAQNINRQSTAAVSSEIIEKTLHQEAVFLKIMDDIVLVYEQIARAKVNRLRQLELGLLGIILLVLFLELLFIFKPVSNRIRHIIQQLSTSEKRANAIAIENATLFKAKEQSLRELQTLNYAIDQTALFVSLTRDGRIIHISEKFKHLLGIIRETNTISFPELLTNQEGEQAYLTDLLKIPRTTIWKEEVNITLKNGKKICLELAIVPINQAGIQQDLLLLCNDLTIRKEAQKSIEQLNQQQLEATITQARLRSVQVVEAQEEERKRIAKDMHDGIGQMLTALKFNLESVNLKHPEKAAAKLTKIKTLAGEVIRGVRVATFNLMPPELSDYGITKGLAKLAEGLSKLTRKKIFFENPTHFNDRFDSSIETNLYRITQEAVNNAIKYADSNYILITLSHSTDLLSIVIDDDGQGFDLANIPKEQTENGSGMGLSFMQERVEYINGRLFLYSKEGEGTRITINMSLGNRGRG